MADLGGTAIVPTAAAEGDLVKESTDASFVADVIQASRETPAIVVFWAPWCGPCKQLGPVLEKAVKAAGGAVRMVKVNVDQNQQVAAQLRVQSIPAVFAFFGGQPVDGFMGALPASEVKAFVKRLVELGGGTGLDEALDQAEQMLESGAAADAAQVFAAVLAEDPANGRALAGWRRPSSPPAMSPRPSSSWPGRCRRSRTTLPSSRPARPSNWLSRPRRPARRPS